MKKVLTSFLILCLLVLVGCEETKENTNNNPDYLKVYTYYKDTDLKKSCENYKDVVKEIPHSKYSNVYPGNLEDDMDMKEAIKTNEGYDYDIVCVIEATYYVSPTTILKEVHEYPLGYISYNQKEDKFSIK